MRRLWKVGLIAVVMVVSAVGALYFLDRPVIPAIGPDIATDHTALLPPDPNEPLPASGAFLVASNCANRLESAAGYADLCWGVVRQADQDVDKDHYAIHVSGTFGGPHVRWIVVEARPLATTMLAGSDGQPIGSSAGCHPLPLSEVRQSGVIYAEQLCGRVVAGPGDVEGSWRVSWACEPCLFLDDADRGIDLEVSVTVPEGVLPNWSIYANLGS